MKLLTTEFCSQLSADLVIRNRPIAIPPLYSLRFKIQYDHNDGILSKKKIMFPADP